MDKRTILGFVLMAVIFIAWMMWTSTNQRPEPNLNKPARTEQQAAPNDTAAARSAIHDSLGTLQKLSDDSLNIAYKYGEFFAPFTKGTESIIVVENDLLRAKLSTKGAAVMEWKLKKYNMWSGQPTQLIQDKKGELYLTLFSRENKKIDTRDLFFTFNNESKNYFRLKGKDSLSLTARLEPAPGKFIEKTFTFYGDKYSVRTNVTLSNMEDFVPNRGYRFEWSEGLKYQENSSVDESSDAVAMASLGGSVEEIDASKDEPVSFSQSGIVNFAAIKSKYFAAAFIPKPDKSFDGTVELGGRRYHAKNEGLVEKYSMTLKVPYRGGTQSRDFDVYIGPLDYSIVNDYGLSALINFGWRFVVRPIGEFFMLPFFNLIYMFVGNYGVSIIIFSLIMKMLLYPLSITQMRSAQKMQLIAPEMTRIRELYKDDQQKQQQETMKLYSQYGVNPAGGCLPLILQMPILYALWSVLRGSIDLRQADFAFWIHDLSLPDTIFDFPFSLMGIKHISGLSLLMGVTLFLQQKMTVTDPRQKSMVYVMPIMFTLMFSNFPAGLGLYYFMFNLMGIAQQVWVNKFSKKKLTLEDLKKMPKKEGWLQKKMRVAQEIAASQGRAVPGQKNQNPNPNYRKKPQSKGKK